MRVLEFDASEVCWASLRSDCLLAVDAVQQVHCIHKFFVNTDLIINKIENQYHYNKIL